jgi:phage protein D
MFATVTSLNVVVTLGGAAVARTDVHDFLIEMDLDQPDMCAISLSNETVRHSEKVREGDDIEVKLGLGNQPNDVKVVFSGEVVGVEPIFEARQPARVIVRGFNALHSLARGKKSVAFLNSSDRDIVERICRDYSLEVDFGGNPPTAKYEHVYQHNQTDLEFLRLRRANRI